MSFCYGFWWTYVVSRFIHADPILLIFAQSPWFLVVLLISVVYLSCLLHRSFLIFLMVCSLKKTQTRGRMGKDAGFVLRI